MKSNLRHEDLDGTEPKPTLSYGPGQHPNQSYVSQNTKATGDEVDKFGPIFCWLTQSFL